MADLSTWIEACRRHLMSGMQEERNVLANPYVAGSGVLTFPAQIDGIVPGIRLSISTNTFYVLDASSTSATATVVGGQEGSTDANAAAGAVVRVRPTFTDHEIVEALRADLADLSAPDNGLFQILSTDVTYSNAATGYELTGISDIIDIYEVRATESGTYKGTTIVNRSLWALDRVADATVFPSGLALQIRALGWSGLPVRVLYRAGFTFPATLATDLTTTGLPDTAWDIPPLGAAMRLLAGREAKRNYNEAQGDTRRAAEVPPGAVANSMRPLAALRAQRIAAESARLVARYPDRRF